AIRDGETLLGSMVLQLSMNRVANILTEREGLGRTGEVYLVNRNNTMLTPSRFINTSPAAFLQVETSAVKEAFSRGGGHRITTDYRGRKVFSSFETFRFEDSVWAILAEKDEGEIITDYYRENAKQLFTRLSERLAARRPAFFQTNLGKITAQGSSRRIKADLQEVQKAGSEETVFTTGVATCTAFAAYMPGRFAYLSHITPTDSAYSPSWATSILLGENHTDLLTKTMERMLWFDVYPFERTQLVFGVFATHDKSLPGILEKLIAQGMELSQIKAVVLPDSPPISVELSPGKKLGIIHIQGEKPGQRLMFSLDDAPTIEQVLKEILAI
ncbi:MAG: hypothetical protein OEZ59_02950, partial [Deltaproteobacteria bacterium]|nr:hypothetical protein [Deltaproteobacteria bacterium]